MNGDTCTVCYRSLDERPPPGRRRRGIAKVGTSAPWKAFMLHYGCLDRALALARREVRDMRAAESLDKRTSDTV